jgi:flagellar biosynthesis protein FlhA
VPTTEPAFGLPAHWVPEASRAEAEALGYTVVDPESVLVTHLTETIRTNAADLLTRQEARDLLTQLEQTNKAVVDEVVPDQLTLGELQRVLQALLAEGVSIRDLGAIVESVGERARLTRDPALLAEYARQALGRTIVAPFVDATQTLRAIPIDPALEQEVAAALTPTAEGELLALDPERAQQLVHACATQVELALGQGLRPVLLCSARVRRHLRRLCEQALPQLVVCSFNEIPPGLRVESIGVLAIDPPAVTA